MADAASADRNIALSNVDAFSKLQLQVRTETAAYKRTAVKSKFAALRESLPEEDQMLLVLRVDKGMAWMDIAGVLFPDSEDDDEARKKESARLRKRFETLKKELVVRGKREGLFDNEPRAPGEPADPKDGSDSKGS